MTDHALATARGIREARAAAGAVQTGVGEGYERPAFVPPDPAMVSEQRYERDFVQAQRARKVSWFNIAQMIGKTVPDLKARYGDLGAPR